MIQSLLRHRRVAMILGSVALVLGIGLTMLLRPVSAQEEFTNRRVLARDVVKLGIIVMANQTPISQSEAKAVLPVLKKIRTQDSKQLNEQLAVTLDAELKASFSPSLRQAVDGVRLPEMDPEMKARLQDPQMQSRLRQLLERRRAQHPDQARPAMRMFDQLIGFFEQTAAGK